MSVLVISPAMRSSASITNSKQADLAPDHTGFNLLERIARVGDESSHAAKVGHHINRRLREFDAIGQYAGRAEQTGGLVKVAGG